MNKKQCWWIFNHDWGKWEYKDTAEDTNKFGLQGVWKIQVKVCKKCGMVKYRQERMTPKR